MAVPPNLARQIKPLLAYYGATDIPVYATSMVFSGIVNSHLDKDLDGIIFCDMNAVFANNGHPVARLYAFGADTYFLANHLAALTAGTPINGNTGQLYLDNTHQVKRQLTLGIFRDGVPVPA